MENNDWNYDVPMRFGENFDYITKNEEEVKEESIVEDKTENKLDFVENKTEVIEKKPKKLKNKLDTLEGKSAKTKKDTFIIVKESSIVAKDPDKTEKKLGKYDEKLLLNMRGFKDRLRKVAKEEGKAHHTFATDIIIAEILRLEKKHKKQKYIEQQYTI